MNLTPLFRMSLLLALLWVLTGCQNQAAPAGAAPGTAPAKSSLLRIAAAADLRGTLDEVLASFLIQNPDAKASITYGSSGSLYAQVSKQAPFDIYLSADISYPEKLAEQGLGNGDEVFPYARGRIVVWVRSESTLDFEKQGLAALADSSVKRLAIANPKFAPYGRAAVSALQSAKVYEAVESRLVLGENISQAAQFAESGAADAAILSRSLAGNEALTKKGRAWLIPEQSHPPIEQGGLITKWAADPRLAQAFRDYLRGADGRRVLEAHGFAVPAGLE